MSPLPQTTSGYDSWLHSPCGAAALCHGRELLRHMLSPWPRRGRKLLALGCGPEGMLLLLREAGFDVTGVDSSPQVIARARARLDNMVGLEVAALDHTPFGDNSFDFAVIPPLPPEQGLLEPILAEAVRLTAGGMLLLFWNPHSLAGLWRTRTSSPLFGLHRLWLPARAYTARLRALVPEARLYLRSTLCAPAAFWVDSTPCQPRGIPNRQGGSASANTSERAAGGGLRHALSACICPLALGALVMLRADYTGGAPLTGMPLRLDTLGDSLGLMPRHVQATESGMKHRQHTPSPQGEGTCPQSLKR